MNRCPKKNELVNVQPEMELGRFGLTVSVGSWIVWKKQVTLSNKYHHRKETALRISVLLAPRQLGYLGL